MLLFKQILVQNISYLLLCILDVIPGDGEFTGHN